MLVSKANNMQMTTFLTTYEGVRRLKCYKFLSFLKPSIVLELSELCTSRGSLPPPPPRPSPVPLPLNRKTSWEKWGPLSFSIHLLEKTLKGSSDNYINFSNLAVNVLVVNLLQLLINRFIHKTYTFWLICFFCVYSTF